MAAPLSSSKEMIRWVTRLGEANRAFQSIYSSSLSKEETDSEVREKVTTVYNGVIREMQRASAAPADFLSLWKLAEKKGNIEGMKLLLPYAFSSREKKEEKESVVLLENEAFAHCLSGSFQALQNALVFAESFRDPFFL